jgi:hypothetical protein
MIKTIQARYNGKDADTGAAIKAGETIRFCTATRRSWKTTAADVHTITLNNQGRYTTYTRNTLGRCIDAPCCGCCTI